VVGHPAACSTSGVPPDEPAALEKKLADIEESTEQRMHFVADLIPEKSEEIHERADRLSERAEVHRRLADDNKEDGSTAADESERDRQASTAARLCRHRNLSAFVERWGLQRGFCEVGP
jgi:hypothetical protein